MDCIVHLHFNWDLAMWVYKQFRSQFRETPSAFISLDVVPVCKMKSKLIMR